MCNVNDLLKVSKLDRKRLEGTTPVIDAVTIMEAEHVNYVVVTNQGAYAGIFSEKDYAQKVVLMRKNTSSTTIGEAITQDLPVVDVDDTAQTCWKLMKAYTTSYLSAFHNFRFIGIVTMTDLLNKAMITHELELV